MKKNELEKIVKNIEAILNGEELVSEVGTIYFLRNNILQVQTKDCLYSSDILYFPDSVFSSEKTKVNNIKSKIKEIFEHFKFNPDIDEIGNTYIKVKVTPRENEKIYFNESGYKIRNENSTCTFFYPQGLLDALHVLWIASGYTFLDKEW